MAHYSVQPSRIGATPQLAASLPVANGIYSPSSCHAGNLIYHKHIRPLPPSSPGHWSPGLKTGTQCLPHNNYTTCWQLQRSKEGEENTAKGSGIGQCINENPLHFMRWQHSSLSPPKESMYTVHISLCSSSLLWKFNTWFIQPMGTLPVHPHNYIRCLGGAPGMKWKCKYEMWDIQHKLSIILSYLMTSSKIR